jgi:hypothetical protein
MTLRFDHRPEGGKGVIGLDPVDGTHRVIEGGHLYPEGIDGAPIQGGIGMIDGFGHRH